MGNTRRYFVVVIRTEDLIETLPTVLPERFTGILQRSPLPPCTKAASGGYALRAVKFDTRVRFCVPASRSSSRLTVKQKRAVPIANEFRFDVVENFLLQLREIHGHAPELRPALHRTHLLSDDGLPIQHARR